MVRNVVVFAMLTFVVPMVVACPEYLNHDFRKLHSTEEVNICEVSGGGPLLIVNTASHCGFTPQFKGLQSVYEKYRDQGLSVIGFASDDFRQESNDEEESAEICYVNFGVTFNMLAPTHVRGAKANAVFAELARQTEAPGWNFNKYLVDSNGVVVARFGSSTKPESEVLEQAIEQALKQQAER